MGYTELNYKKKKKHTFTNYLVSYLLTTSSILKRSESSLFSMRLEIPTKSTQEFFQ